MSSELLCKDCKHSFRNWRDLPFWGNGYEYRCRKSWVDETIEHDPVTGPKKIPGYYARCSLIRLHDADYRRNCGKEALWWEPKNKKLLFLQIKHSDR